MSIRLNAAATPMSIRLKANGGTASLRLAQGRTGPAGPAGPKGADGEPGPALPQDQLDALDGTYAAKGGLSFEPARNVTTETVITGPAPIDAFDGYLYGATGNTLYRATNEDGPWEQLATLNGTGDTGQGITGLRPLGDGEVLALKMTDGLWKSSGWATNPTTATFSRVLDTIGGGSVEAFTTDTDPDTGWVATAPYSLAGTSSRYAWLSTDNGETFTQVYDFATEHPAEFDPAQSHMHFMVIDHHHTGPNPRLWMYFHRPLTTPLFKRLMYSDDAGATWTTFNTTIGVQNAVATPQGMIFTSDDTFNGLYKVDRDTMVMEEFVRLRRDTDSYWAIGKKAFGPDDAGLYHFALRSDTPGIPPAVMSSDGVRGAEVLTLTPADGNDEIDIRNLVSFNGRLLGEYRHTGDANKYRLAADVPLRGVPPEPDNGVDGGTAGERSVAVGIRSTANLRAVAIGAASGATDLDTVAIGYGAQASSDNGVAIGSGASSTVNGIAIGKGTTVGEGVTIGYNATTAGNGVSVGQGATTGDRGAAIGSQATASGLYATSLGYNADSTGDNAVALGRDSVADQLGAIAIGSLSDANHQMSVAIGYNVQTTAANQVNIEGRHIEATELGADPTAPAVNAGRLYFKDNGAGKTQLCVRFNTGAVQVIAVEP